MASLTEITRNKRTRKHKNGGRARKIKMAKKSTASYEELFAACGEPGQAAPKAEAKAQAAK